VEREDANGNGVVSKLNVATRQQLVLWTFSGADGSQPYGGLVRDAQRDLFGTTQYGGTFNLGTVFRLAASGKLTTLHNFTGGNDGSYPVAGLAINSKGELFGAASEGGSAGYGTIFSITFP
ncbi:MAG TPA: choice-of-anchor tandem repeat GloVer-containing protein, partial [Bryobacteraceae bacterium]|nr:choice-of-anchor tandem repeat GloVer-containing protein [Bryobacteraceae bacterium]